MLTCYSHTVRLPRSDLAYLAFRLALQETLTDIELHLDLGEEPDGSAGFLAEVPFLEQVPLPVQVDPLADSWTRHDTPDLVEASLPCEQDPSRPKGPRMPEPLNPALFRTLQARFGDVRITNAGQQRRVRCSPDPARPGRLKQTVIEWGEQYQVNCPICGDTRHRLAISYVYGVPDRRTGSPNYTAAYCQNEHCFRDPAKRARHREMLAMPMGRRLRQRVPQPVCQTTVEQSAPLSEVAPPQRIVPIAQLPPHHPAIQYLWQRRFDPQQIWARWQVCYCDWSNHPRPTIRDSLVIPIHHPRGPEDVEVVVGGWQARAIHPAPGQPKYLSAETLAKRRPDRVVCIAGRCRSPPIPAALVGDSYWSLTT